MMMTPLGSRIETGGGTEEFQALREELISLRNVRSKQSETEETLIAELRLKCEKVIELEVLLDEERGRANCLERARQEDEALSGELRDIMADVGAVQGPSTLNLSLNPTCTSTSTSTSASTLTSTSTSTSTSTCTATSTSTSTSAYAYARVEHTVANEKEGTITGTAETSNPNPSNSPNASNAPCAPNALDSSTAHTAPTAPNGGDTKPCKDENFDTHPPSRSMDYEQQGQGSRDDGTAASQALPALPALPGPKVSSKGEKIQGWTIIPISQGNNSDSVGDAAVVRGGRNTSPRREADHLMQDPGDYDALTLASEGGERDEPAEATPTPTPTPTPTQGDGEHGDSNDNKNGEAHGSPSGGGLPQGMLRARVVELELQRQEAVDALKVKTEESLRLEVQVEQLKNVVESLSHASPDERRSGWQDFSTSHRGGKGGIMNLSPFFTETPGIEPSLMLLLHRTPWAEGVSDGVRKEETVLEWQGKTKTSRGDWNARPGSLPPQLTSLPEQRPAGLHLPRSRTGSPKVVDEASPLSAVGGNTLPIASATTNESETSSAFGAGTEATFAESKPLGASGNLVGLRDRIGEAVAGLGGGAGGAWGRVTKENSLVTDLAISRRFTLGSVELPSDHWEWVGGWMVDSETDVATDPDGWVYGRDPREISDIANGRYNKNPPSDSFATATATTATTATVSANADASAADANANANAGGPDAHASVNANADADDPLTGENMSRGGEIGMSAGGVSVDQSGLMERRGSGHYNHNDNGDATGDGDDGVGDGNGECNGDADGDGDGRTSRKEERNRVGIHGGSSQSWNEGGSKRDYHSAGANDGNVVLRRRRLVRLRMVTRVDGAREPTKRFLEMMRRVCSLEILVRKLSHQVLTLQRQVTIGESQLAFLSPLQSKLRQVCAMGRRDRQRGDALHRKLIEAENELKVLKRCVTGSNPAPRERESPASAASLIMSWSSTSPKGAANSLDDGDGLHGPPNSHPREHDASGTVSIASGSKAAGTPVPARDSGGRGNGASAAWAWVGWGGVAQRAAGSFARRSPPIPRDDEEEEEEETSRGHEDKSEGSNLPRVVVLR